MRNKVRKQDYLEEIVCGSSKETFAKHTIKETDLKREDLSFAHSKMAVYTEIIENLRGTFKSGITKNVKYRKTQLENLIRLYNEGEDELITALKEDLGKPETEALMFEIDFNKNFVKTVLASMDK